MRAGGLKLSASFLILDVGNSYKMLLGRPWLKVAKALHNWEESTLTLKSKGRSVVVKTDSRLVANGFKPKMLVQKQSTRKIELMLASMNILPTTEIDLNVVMADLDKAEEQKLFFPERFQEDTTGEREVRKTGKKNPGKGEKQLRQKVANENCHN